ncbi:MAG: KEOPS complex subunit Cgi121 [Candidatus Bathyarchaeota archaeon]|nr:KEOPS complex subunit Cgi121 [Candidatus Bathyarchaeota archaeon]
MLKYIKEFDTHLEITGFENVRIPDIGWFLKTIRKEKPKNVEIQFFDAKLVSTWQHLYFAVLNALTAFKNKGNISKSLAMEIMLYASAQHQIRKATKLFGIKSPVSNVAMLVVGEKSEDVKLAISRASKHVKAQADEAVLEMSEEKAMLIRKVFGISETELETMIKENNSERVLTDLVIERMALLGTQR